MKVLKSFAVLTAVLLAGACSTAPGQDILDAVKGTWKGTLNGAAVTAVVGDTLKVTADNSSPVTVIFEGKRDGVIKANQFSKDVLVYKDTRNSPTVYSAAYYDGTSFWMPDTVGSGITSRDALKTGTYIVAPFTKQ